VTKARVGRLASGLLLLAGCSGKTAAKGLDPFVMPQAAGVAGSVGGQASAAGAGGAGGSSPVAGLLVDGPITNVVPSDGCGKPPAGTGLQHATIPTMGVKDADCADHLNGKKVCGPWSTPRDYLVYLPANYDPNKPYPLILSAPACGGNSGGIYQLASPDAVIRVGISPGPNSLGHGTNENQGCFDDKEGDDSIDWVFYEALYDRLNAEICFDRNRLFASGDGSGAWFSNELGCKYAGDPRRPVRGVMVNMGGLPTDPKQVPTCSSAAMAGMWVNDVSNVEVPFANDQVAIARAMSHGTCTLGTDYDSASFENFPIGGGRPDDTCKRILGCDQLYPLVVCLLQGNPQTNDSFVVNPGFTAFIKSFESAPLRTP
jgi:hypothetical protein